MKSDEYERPVLYLYRSVEKPDQFCEGNYQIKNSEENLRCIIIDLNDDEENEFVVSPYFLDLNPSENSIENVHSPKLAYNKIGIYEK